MAAGFPQSQWLKRVRKEDWSCNLFITYSQKQHSISSTVFYSIEVVTMSCLHVMGGKLISTSWGEEYQRICRHVFKTTTCLSLAICSANSEIQFVYTHKSVSELFCSIGLICIFCFFLILNVGTHPRFISWSSVYPSAYPYTFMLREYPFFYLNLLTLNWRLQTMCWTLSQTLHICNQIVFHVSLLHGRNIPW